MGDTKGRKGGSKSRNKEVTEKEISNDKQNSNPKESANPEAVANSTKEDKTRRKVRNRNESSNTTNSEKIDERPNEVERETLTRQSSETAESHRELGEIEGEEALDYEEDLEDNSNKSNSAQKDEEAGYRSEGGSTVYSKTSETGSTSEREVTITPKKRKLSKRDRKEKAAKIKRKRKRVIISDSSSSTSSDSDSDGKSGKYYKKKSVKRRKKKAQKTKRDKRKKRNNDDSSEEEDLKGITPKRLKEMFAEYYNARKAEEQEHMMSAIPAEKGQGNHPELLNIDIRNLRLAEVPSETTILSRAIKNPTNGNLVVPGLTGPRTTSDSDNVINNSQTQSSSDSFDLSHTGERVVPSPPAQISDDPDLTEAMNRPEWNKAIDKARDDADRMIREAEKDKARMVKPVGECVSSSVRTREVINVIDTIPRDVNTDRCDELVHHVSAHVDDNMRTKIQRGEFVELEKLLPKDHFKENGQKVKVTNCEGETYYIPQGGDPHQQGIFGYKKWAKCFRIYAEIYASANPTKAGEIFQYMDSIENAANLYVWENVARYDDLFRRQMAKFPHREWSKKYKDMYEAEMKEQLAVRAVLNSVKKQSANTGKKPLTGVCWRFNKHGKCDLGAACTLDHKCDVCGKFGHSRVNCFKNNQNQSNNNNNNNNKTPQPYKRRDK